MASGAYSRDLPPLAGQSPTQQQLQIWSAAPDSVQRYCIIGLALGSGGYPELAQCAKQNYRLEESEPSPIYREWFYLAPDIRIPTLNLGACLTLQRRFAGAGTCVNRF